MKRFFLFAISSMMSLLAMAQSSEEDVDMIQAIYGKEKKAIVADFIMPADDAKTKAFWTLYDAYESERKALGKKRIALLEKYAGIYNLEDDKSTDGVMLETMALQKKVDGIINTYYGKIKKSVGVKQAAQFYQLESYLLSATRIYVLGSIPFIDELEKLPAPPTKTDSTNKQ
ncbi:MAG TPA: hypothetical protein VLC28_07480 [Flavitalea sp.]|nr:hypothetical protein [Flavitalea sp.]